MTEKLKRDDLVFLFRCGKAAYACLQLMLNTYDGWSDEAISREADGDAILSLRATLTAALIDEKDQDHFDLPTICMALIDRWSDQSPAGD